MAVRRYKEAIHSGHFMVSNFEAEEEYDDDIAIPVPNEDSSTEKVPVVQQKVQNQFKSLVNLLNTNTLPNLQHASLIDVSLTKLFQCMSIAYRQKLTSPKWNRFLGMKLRWKDKFRLNNVIWRCWHMQFIKGHRKLVCAFANPMELDNHNKTEAGAIMEGKYWKRKMNMILAEYKKWRIFYKNQHNWGPSDSVKQFPDLNTSVEGLKTGKDDIELETLITDHDFFVDALFNSLGSQSVHIQDTEKFLGSEFLQPSGPSLNLQPNIEELMDLDPLAPIQDWLSSKLPENMDVTLQNIKDIEVSAVSYHPFSHATLRDVEGYPGGKTGTGFSGGETGSEKASYHSQPSTSTFSSYNEYKRKPPLPGKKLWAIQQQQQELQQQQQQQQQRQQQQLLADYNTPHVSVIQNSHSVYLTPEPAPVSLTPCQQTSVIKSLGPYQPTPSYLTPRDHLSQETVKQDKSSELVQLLQNKTPSRQTGAKHKKEEAEDLSHRGGKHKRIVSIPPPPATCQPQPSLSLDLSHSQDPITDPVKVSSAEHKRKHSIKTGFDFLRTQIPSLAGTPNLKISKAALLARGADHVDYLSKVNVSLGQEVEALRKSVQALNTEITNFQSELPTAGSAAGRTGREDSGLERLFDSHVATCTMKNWKYFVFSKIMRPLLQSYDRTVSSSSITDLSRTCSSWLDQHVSLVQLRPHVLNSLKDLSIETEILSEPHKMPQEALNSVSNMITPKLEDKEENPRDGLCYDS